ncbi:MAG: tetratricopeptide repeat protein [Candidatus Doudnabacteria bacterium]
MILFIAILFVASVLVIVSMFLVKLAQLNQRPVVRVKLAGVPPNYYETLWPYFRQKLVFIANKLWRFILEAKDLTPAATKTLQTSVAKAKNVFRIRIRSSASEPQWLPEAAELSIKPTVSQNPEDLYLEAIKKNPNDKQAYEALGRLYLQNKNYSDASQTYEYLTKLDAGRDIYFSNLGLAYYSLGEYQKAAASYEKALNINNKVATRWINLALCFEALDEFTKAVKAITQALVLDKLNVNYLMLLADTYIMLDNSIRAEEVLEQIMSMDPMNKPAREKLMKLKVKYKGVGIKY